MGWFWADAPSSFAAPKHPTSGSPPPSCPMHQRAAPPAPGCPIKPSSSSSTDADEHSLNPLNFMFAHLPQTRSPGQKTALPTLRETSSIPKAEGAELWEYPSPQQMYNAMRRKGYDEAPEDAVTEMVAVHNWLNEGAWNEILQWEKEFGSGVLAWAGWRERVKWYPRLARFQGRSKDLTPKARVLQMVGRVMPETFGTPPPFDRHDWYVVRHFPGEEKPREVRYVIDYYAGPPEPTGEPVFYLDVRPAVDRPGAVAERVVKWSRETWDKASGTDIRKEQQEAEKRKQEGGL